MKNIMLLQYAVMAGFLFGCAPLWAGEPAADERVGQLVSYQQAFDRALNYLNSSSSADLQAVLAVNTIKTPLDNLLQQIEAAVPVDSLNDEISEQLAVLKKPMEMLNSVLSSGEIAESQKYIFLSRLETAAKSARGAFEVAMKKKPTAVSKINQLTPVELGLLAEQERKKAQDLQSQIPLVALESSANRPEDALSKQKIIVAQLHSRLADYYDSQEVKNSNVGLEGLSLRQEIVATADAALRHTEQQLAEEFPNAETMQGILELQELQTQLNADTSNVVQIAQQLEKIKRSLGVTFDESVQIKPNENAQEVEPADPHKTEPSGKNKGDTDCKAQAADAKIARWLFATSGGVAAGGMMYYTYGKKSEQHRQRNAATIKRWHVRRRPLIKKLEEKKKQQAAV